MFVRVFAVQTNNMARDVHITNLSQSKLNTDFSILDDEILKYLSSLLVFTQLSITCTKRGQCKTHSEYH